MYLLTETASPFALERWAAFFANFGQFAKGFFYTLGISIGALIVALLLGLIFGAMSSTHNKVQRIAIARGLAMNPELLLFDEPTSALDPETIGDVLAVMQNLAKGGMNMVVVTHEMGFARSVADRIIFMAEGQVLVDTTDVDGFFDNPTEPRAVQFLSKIIDHNSDRVQVDA